MRLITSTIHPIGLPLPDSPEGWIPYSQFSGRTPSLSFMGCHVSVLSPGASPHPPHSHVEEELLIVLAGEADIIIASSEEDPTPRRERLQQGQFSYYPAWQHHTIQNLSSFPVTYMMFKWTGKPSGAEGELAAGVFDCRPFFAEDRTDAFSVRRLFDAPTGWLRRLHSHATVLESGGGYEPHVDAYDVAIVLMEGTIETMGERVTGAGVVYYAEGIPHGMHNPGPGAARYIVFEFESGTQRTV
jgi:mannose-6-phosphate isomerase-like protein (cupin superfamily)